MKIEKRFFSENEVSLKDADKGTGLSEKAWNELMQKANAMDSKNKQVSEEAVESFKYYSSLALSVADTVLLDVGCETKDTYGEITFFSETICFPSVIESTAKENFATLILNADDIYICNKNGGVSLRLVFIFTDHSL